MTAAFVGTKTSTNNISDLNPLSINYWTRPTEWLTLPTLTASDQKLVGLVTVANTDSEFLALLCAVNSGTYTVDWGDGNVETFTSNTQANHRYDYASISSTLTSDNQKQVIVQVYPTTGGSTISTLTLNVKYANSTLIKGTLNTYCNSWMDIALAAPNMTTLNVGNGGAGGYLSKVQQFKIIRTGAVGAFDLGGLSALQNVEIDWTGMTAVNMQNMFNSCYSLTVAPYIAWNKCTNAFSMFQNCYSLKYVADATTSFSASYVPTNSVTRIMFENCYSLVNAPWLDLSNNYSCQRMFNGCRSLQYVPNYSFAICTSISQMFQDCVSLKYIPDMTTTSALTDASSAFQGCDAIAVAPTLSVTSGLNTTSSMFSGCRSLKSIAIFDTANVTNSSSMFATCSKITSLPDFNLAKVTNGSSFVDSSSLSILPAYNYANATNLGSIFPAGNNASQVNCINMKANFNVSGQKLSTTALETMFNNMSSNSATTVTITNNWGADTAVTSNLTAGQAAGSTTLTVAASSGYTIGQYVTNAVAFGDTAVTFQDTGDTVTKTSHGLSNGTRVSFPTIVTTTGISVYTIYYVVNTSTNTFQVASSVGGSALPLTNNGTGTLRYEVTITGKPTSTTVTISAPTTTTTTATALSGRFINTYLATLKAWTVTG